MARQERNGLHWGRKCQPLPAGLDGEDILQRVRWSQISQRLKNWTGMGNMPETTPTQRELSGVEQAAGNAALLCQPQ